MEPCAGDVDGDCNVGVADVVTVLANFGVPCQ
jgi:hypothetical protein